MRNGVPYDLIHPYLLTWINQWEEGGGDRWHMEEVLAERSGLAVDTIGYYITNARDLKTLSFDVADALLTALDLTHLWWTVPELIAVYQSVDLSDWEDIDPNYQCILRHPASEYSVTSTNGGKGRKVYCKACNRRKPSQLKRKREWDKQKRAELKALRAEREQSECM